MVQKDDTLERIAAIHDCTVGELVKQNKLHSRMVYFLFEYVKKDKTRILQKITK